MVAVPSQIPPRPFSARLVRIRFWVSPRPPCSLGPGLGHPTPHLAIPAGGGAAWISAMPFWNPRRLARKGRKSNGTRSFLHFVLRWRLPVSLIIFDWRRLLCLDVHRRLLPDLYPSGPMDQEVWARAGRDPSGLHHLDTGQALWLKALRMLRLGGGGVGIHSGSL